MATIGSLLDIQLDYPKHEFLFEQLLQPTFETSHMEMVCNIIGPQSPWYQHMHAFLIDGTIPENIS